MRFVDADFCIAFIFAIRTTTLTTGLSLVRLSALTTERYLGIVHPIYHRANVTKKRVLTCVFLGVFVVLLFTVASFLPRFEIIKTGGLVALLLFFVVNTIAYIKMHLVARKVVVSKVKPGNGTTKENKKKTRLRREIKHAISCFLAVVCFLFLTPYTLQPLFVQFGENIWSAYLWYSLSLLILNSSVNSIICFWKN